MGMPVGARAGFEAHRAERTRAGAGASMIGSCHTVPVKLSADRGATAPSHKRECP